MRAKISMIAVKMTAQLSVRKPALDAPEPIELEFVRDRCKYVRGAKPAPLLILLKLLIFFRGFARGGRHNNREVLGNAHSDKGASAKPSRSDLTSPSNLV